ncbi:ATP-binding protein [Streptomyces bryophytorum]|nr:ATP-binding protein [Actinacidiphila bryophytorum]MBN6546883.1 ATP-binding protein [Actinacidiphila bryophytorum]
MHVQDWTMAPLGMPYGRGDRSGPERGRPTDTTGNRLRYAVGREDLRAVADTRRRLRDQLRQWGVPALADTAELLATEIVTNALQHTGGGAVLTATLSPGPARRLRVEVHDTADRRPPQRPQGGLRPSDEATSGRGLLLVEALADTWGVQARGAGKTVWFELGARAA